MISLDDVARVCLALPETTEVASRGARQWRVRDKLFVWERTLRRAGLEELGKPRLRGRYSAPGCRTRVRSRR